jgi:hypothetical protein
MTDRDHTLELSNQDGRMHMGGHQYGEYQDRKEGQRQLWGQLPERILKNLQILK